MTKLTSRKSATHEHSSTKLTATQLGVLSSFMRAGGAPPILLASTYPRTGHQHSAHIVDLVDKRHEHRAAGECYCGHRRERRAYARSLY
jgi:hypothetical protein